MVIVDSIIEIFDDFVFSFFLIEIRPNTKPSIAKNVDELINILKVKLTSLSDCDSWGDWKRVKTPTNNKGILKIYIINTISINPIETIEHRNENVPIIFWPVSSIGNFGLGSFFFTHLFQHFSQ